MVRSKAEETLALMVRNLMDILDKVVDHLAERHDANPSQEEQLSLVKLLLIIKEGAEKVHQLSLTLKD